MKRLIKIIMLAAAICCIASVQAQTIVKMKKTGTLGQMVGELRLDTCSYLAIEGKLNSADIRVLRQLAGYEEKGGSSGNLLMLDLRKAKFASDDEPFMELDASKEKLAGVIQPYKANESSTWIPSLNYLSSRLGKPIRSRSSLGDGGIFGRVYGSRRVIAYKPIYYLNHTLDVPLQVITTIKLQNDRESSAESESVFYAKNGIGDSLWKAIRKKGLERCKGHVLERREDGSCWLKVSSRKGNSPRSRSTNVSGCVSWLFPGRSSSRRMSMTKATRYYTSLARTCTYGIARRLRMTCRSNYGSKVAGASES